MKKLIALLVIVFCVGLPGITLAADPGSLLLTVSPEGHTGETSSLSIQVLLFIGALILLPAGLVTMISFVRIIIELVMFRQAQDEAASGSHFADRLKEALVQQFGGKRIAAGSRESVE